MAPDEVDALVAGMARRRVVAGERVIVDGTPNDALFVVVRGAFSVGATVRGKPVRFGERHPGDAFGELSLLTSENAVADVTATSPGELLVLSRGALDRLRERSPVAEI